MGLLNQRESQPIPDVFGVPTYTVDTFFSEPTIGGWVRLYACSTMNGLIVPQYIANMPPEVVLKASSLVREVALSMIRHDTGLRRH